MARRTERDGAARRERAAGGAGPGRSVGARRRRDPGVQLPPRSRVPWAWFLVVGVLLVGAGGATAIAILAGGGPGAGEPIPWSTLRTQDVHSLAFDPADPERMFFGHHGGLLETTDGGRTWQTTGLRGADAMNVGRPAGGFFQIAGHGAYMETTDGGRTWESVPNDLPGLDLHLFAADPRDPARAWAFSVGYGLFETGDRGRTWELRQPGAWGAIAAFAAGGRTVLLAINDQGLRRSEDGGRTWGGLTLPDGKPASLAASADGGEIYIGTTDGLIRSIDGGATWSPAGLSAIPVALAVSPLDASVVTVVDDQGRLFRTFDGGRRWPGPGER